ncbi:hypothetical protein D1872_221290 [compost metagenome]
MVLAEEPHDIVARLVDPISEVKHGILDLPPDLLLEYALVAIISPQPEQGGQIEVCTVPPFPYANKSLKNHIPRNRWVAFSRQLGHRCMNIRDAEGSYALQRDALALLYTQDFAVLWLKATIVHLDTE